MGTGTLEARVKTTISPRIQERLAEVFVDQGGTVQPGQLLARFDVAETRLAAARTFL
jgi:multidrug efflux pump subunit AcrA (membrane-fusion protein)